MDIMQQCQISALKDWNILFITSDEHNAKVMGCAGNPVIKTPAMDRLAREGMMFTKAYCADPVCAPTRQSMYTGLYPQEHGQFGNSIIFSEHNKTWAHHFKKHGYTTAVIGKTHDNNPEYDLGFDLKLQKGENIRNTKPLKRSEYDPDDQLVYNSVSDVRFSGMVINDPLAEHDGIVLNESIRYLKENKDKKFFLHVSFTKPHWPWNAPKEFYYMYDPEKIDMPHIIPEDLDGNILAKDRYFGDTKWNEITEEQNRLFRARYYGSISWLDSNISKVLDTLDELDLAKKTLVVYSTDHGDMAAEKGLWLKNIMYDGAARIPFIIRAPGVIEAGTKNSELINHVDFFPTFAIMVGAEKDLPDNLTGKDLSGVILGKEKGPEFTFSVNGVTSADEPPKQVMARSQRWKFIRYDIKDESNMYVLYDMENDPDEIHNLAYNSECQDVVRLHNDAVNNFLASLKKPKFEPKKLKNKIKRSFVR